MKIAIVGITGLVGKEMLKILELSNINNIEVIPFASEKSEGNVVEFKGKKIKIKNLKKWKKEVFDYALFSVDSSISLEYAPLMVKEGIVVIDNSSAFRQQKDIPLVIPSVNKHRLLNNPLLISNPNCSTIQLVKVLSKIELVNSIKRVVVSTYQSVSGAGSSAINELLYNTKSFIDKDNKIKIRQFSKNIAFNCIPHIDTFDSNGYTKEELKMINETSKIMEREIPLTVTCVRVPTIIGHCESVNIECIDKVFIDLIKGKLGESRDIVVKDDKLELEYPTNEDSIESDSVFVGRLRKDNTLDNAMNLWIVANNLRVGAATNTIDILNAHIKLNKL